MIWRFTLIDRNNVATVIDEPVGWDSMLFELNRNLDWHGIFFTKQGDSQFEFDGKAMRLLKAEYEKFGCDGLMFLKIEQDCGIGFEGGIVQKFVFSKYDFTCDGGCMVRVPVETTSEVMDLRNRINQKVNLETTKAFDETTTLSTYTKLPFEMELPSKGIFLQNKATNTNLNARTFDFYTDMKGGMFELGMDKTNFSEIGGFYFNAETVNTKDNVSAPGGGVSPDAYPVMINPSIPLTIYVMPNFVTPVLNYAKEFKNTVDVGNSDINTSFRIKGRITATGRELNHIFLLFMKRSANDVYTELYKEIYFSNYPTPHMAVGNYVDFDSSYSDVLNLDFGDRLYLFITYNIPISSGSWPAVTNAVSIQLTTESFFYMNVLSHTPVTTSKVFAINETISRIAETITNDKIRAYSEYFGRTDSQPYTVDADGCGSLEVVTDGLRIRRQQSKTPGKTIPFTLSLQDAFEILNPIHNIGMGVEADTKRLGYNRLRVEPWQYFYNETLIMSCTGIQKLNRKAQASEIYSTFQFGYNKWEAEEFNGLDEFLTKRNYRTSISSVKNDLIKLCKAIASGYALEITRRRGNDDSKDWRYDKDTFIICCKRSGGGNMVVELGNVTSPANIIDPSTIYNYRISPVRNAMRWMNIVLRSYRQFNSNAKIIFTDGDGNCFAEGKMTSTSCRLEAGVVKENQSIDLNTFFDTDNARPVMLPERVLYDYPMSLVEYKAIEASPYGKIYFESDCDSGYGWIDSLKYKPEEGLATFNLIPKA